MGPRPPGTSDLGPAPRRASPHRPRPAPACPSSRRGRLDFAKLPPRLLPCRHHARKVTAVLTLSAESVVFVFRFVRSPIIKVWPRVTHSFPAFLVFFFLRSESARGIAGGRLRVSAPPCFGTLRALGTRARKANHHQPSTHPSIHQHTVDLNRNALLVAVSREEGNGGSIKDVATVTTQGAQGAQGRAENIEPGKSHGKGRGVEQVRARTPRPPHPIRLLSSNLLCTNSVLLTHFHLS